MTRSPAFLAYQVVGLWLLNAVGMRGSKILVTLYALDNGASTLTVGVLAAMYAVFPLLLAVHAGKISDRIGDRMPIIAGGSVMVAGLALPFFSGEVAFLLGCAALVGLGHIYLHVAVHNLLGSFGGKEDRTRSFSTFALGASIAGFIGPSVTGFAIDTLGYRWTALALAATSLIPVLAAIVSRAAIPVRHGRGKGEAQGSAFDLFSNVALRRTIITSGICMTAIELFNFYFPVYGRSVGLSASAIGLVLATYAVAGFVVRIFLHRLARRYGEAMLLAVSLTAGAAIYAVFPSITNIGLLGALAFVLGLGLGMSQPLTLMITYNHAPQGRSGEALGLRLMVNKVIQVAVPLAFGGLSATTGLGPVFWSCALALLGGGAMSMRDVRDRRAA